MKSPTRRAALFIRLLEFQLDESRAYRDEVATSLRGRLNQIGERAKDLEPDRQDEYFDWMYDEIAQVRDSFPQLLRSTTLIALYSLLEHRLFEICEILRKEDKLSLGPNDLKGAGVEQARAFIQRACGRSFPDQSAEWQTIQNVRKVRNCLVHNGGVVENGEKGDHTRKAIEALGGATLNEKGEIFIDEKLLNDFTECVLDFFRKLAPTTI